MLKVYRVSTVDFNQLDTDDQAAQIDLLQSFASSNGDIRLLSYVMPWNKKRWLRERGKLAKDAAHAWQSRGYQEEIRLGSTISDEIRLQTMQHYLLMFDYQAGAGELSSWGLTAEVATPPPSLNGDYKADIDHLYPVRNGKRDNSRPYASIIASYEFRERWDWIDPLTSLLSSASGPLVLCVDSERVSQRAVEFSVNSLQAATTDITRASDREMLIKFADANMIMTEVARGQGLHNVRVFIMLLENDLGKLRERRLQIKTKLSPFMHIHDMRGLQDKAALMFSPEYRPTGLPATQHNVLSRGLGRMLGQIGFASHEQYSGTYMGVGRGIYGNITGITYLNLWQGQSAAHMLWLGETGFGKTVAANAFMARQVEAGTQAIFMEPQGHSERLARYLGRENALYNKVSYETISYNPLDVVASNFADQFDYFLLLLEFMLNPRGDEDKRPRRFLTNEETAAVNEALKRTYAGYDWQNLMDDQSGTPLMELFVTWLKKAPHGAKLAEELDRLYVHGPWANTFNRTSTLSVRLKRPDGSLWPAVIYDLSELTKPRRPLFYFVILAGISRESRRKPKPGEDRPRRLVVVDEFRYVTGGTNLTEWLADQIATSRTFRVAYALIDQNPRTLAGVSDDGVMAMGDSGDAISRQHMLDNIQHQVFFRLKSNAAKVIKRLYPDLTDSHISFLKNAGTGQALVRSNGRISIVDMQLRTSEYNHFIGS